MSTDREPTTEPGTGPWLEDDHADAWSISEIFEAHLDDDEELNSAGLLVLTTAGMPPDGQAKGTLTTTVTDQNGRPVSGVRVSYSLSFVRPGGDWRSAAGMKRLYDGSNGDGNKAQQLVNSGVIRVMGSLSATSALTDGQGKARITYTTSHIASDYGQSGPGIERITSTLPNGSSSTTDVQVGWTGLSPVPTVAGGLRVIGARGTYVHPDLAGFLNQLGSAIKQANWPHPATLTAASLRWGGQYPPHFTHKHGASIDLRPMSTDGGPTWAREDGSSAGNYDAERTKALVGALKSAGATVYFNGKDAGGTPKAGHHNHLHATWLRGSAFTTHAPQILVSSAEFAFVGS